MDSLISAAARALAGGDPLRALNHVSLRDDAPALALRGIAMAQLGDLVRARALLRRAARAFTAKETVARARCVVAEAEVALAARDLHASSKALEAARETLQRHGDTVNAAHARYLTVHRLLLIGRLDDAEAQLDALNPDDGLPPALQATHQLAVAGIALRRLDTRAAHTALGHAGQAAERSGIAALINEVNKAARALRAPAARLVTHDQDRPVRLDEVEALFASPTLAVDACRYQVRQAGSMIELATRPVLFTLARTLAEAWPGDARRDTLIERAFRLRQVEDSHRARLRVEIGRLRKALRPLARLHATRHGFKLEPLTGDVAVLARPVEDKHAPILAFLSDGEAWSSSALALALGTSQRTVQRALDALANAGKVEAIGQGRARRWVASPVLGFTTTLLLTAPLPGG